MLELIPGLGKVLAFARTGFIKLGLAMLTTPIGWIITGIAALVAGFIYLWKNCEGFRNFFINMWEGIKSAWNAFLEYGAAFLEGFLEPFQTAGEWLGEKFVDIFDVVADKIQVFVKIWNDAWDGIKNGIKATVDFIIKVIDAVLSPIETLKKAMSFVKDAGGWIVDKLGFGSEGNVVNETAGDTVNNYDNSRGVNNYNTLQQTALPAMLAQYQTPIPAQNSSAKVEVSFKNMPKEASVDRVSENGPMDLGVEYGYAW